MVTKLNLFDNFNQLTPYAVGFDRVFDQLNNYASHNATSSGFPPYNIRKEGDYSFVIELALAGFSKKDIEVEVADGLLTIRSVKENDENDSKGNKFCLEIELSDAKVRTQPFRIYIESDLE